MFINSDHIIYYAGVMGVIIFMIMRSSVDINSGVSINENRLQTEMRAATLSNMLGIDTDTDSLVFIATRKQEPAFYVHLRDSVLNSSGLSPARANMATYPLTGWQVVLSKTTDVPGAFRSVYSFFERLGGLFIHIDDHQRVRYALIHHNIIPELFAYTDPWEIADELVFNHFNYDGRFYRFLPDGYTADTGNGIRVFRFEKIARGSPGPEFLMLTMSVHTVNGDIRYRFREFESIYYNGEEYAIPGSSRRFDLFNETLIGYAVHILVIFLVLFIGIRQIFKGRVEWRRGLLLGLFFALAYFLWTSLFMNTTYHKLYTGQLVIVDLISSALTGIIYGCYVSIAYIAWESVSREFNLKDTVLFDAVWNFRLFNNNLGQAIVSGYAIAGIMLAIFASGLFTFGAIYGQQDSVFISIREPSSLLPSFTTGLNTWMSAVMLGFVYFGVVINYLRVKMSDLRLFLLAASLIIALSFIYLNRFATTTTGFGPELLIFSAVGLPLVLGYLYYGLMSVLFSSWAFMLVIKLPPYLNSASMDVTIHALALFLIFLIPLVHGIFAYLIGSGLPEDGIYVPEYEQKLAKQLRFEREFEIAKSSQHALMPKSAPVINGIDVEGFFIPSFEVGGDFYDYAVQVNHSDMPEALVIVVADVSGKSIKAAFNAIFTSGLLLSRMKKDLPEQVLIQANPVLYQKTDAQTFITCQVCQYRLSEKILRISNAGHCPPIIKRGEVVTEIQMQAPKYPLGIRPEVDYKGVDIQLRSGDVVLLYSDGLPEARNRKGDRIEFNGVRTLMQNLNTEELSSAEICNHIRKYILTYSDYELADDTTVVCLKVQ